MPEESGAKYGSPQAAAAYRTVWEQGAECLEQAGIADAKLDARLLLEAVCHTSLNTLLAEPSHTVTAEQKAQYDEMIRRRMSHEPTAYILGSQEFMGLDFTVTPAVLIPNQDTETLVELVRNELHSGMRILDLCTGSGCILLSLLHYSLNTIGVGTDLSKEALKIAEENAHRLGLAERCTFLQGDLFEALKGLDESFRQFDLLVSNPPYIRREVIGTLEKEFSQAEPYLALCGGEDGLDFYRRIAQEAARVVRPGGTVCLEIGYDQAKAVCGLLQEAGYREISVTKDYGGLDRVVSCRTRIPGV